MIFLLCYHRLKKDISVQREEIRSLKKEELNMQTELDDLRNEVERTRPKLEKITQYEEELHNLTEQNNSLHSDLISLQEQYESILHERDDLEQQTKDVFEALNEEREAKTMLETRLQEDMLRSPDRVPWLTESITHLASDIDPLQSISAPTSPLPNGDNIHSTPFSTKPRLPSLLSELQHSFLPSATSELQLSSSGQNRLGEVQIKLKETEAKNHVLESEKAQLEKKVRELEVMCNELEKWRVKYQQDIEGKEVDITSLKDELTAKKEIIGQLKSKLSSLSGEKATLEIELEGSKEEMSRLRDTSKLEGEKLQKEIAEEQVRSVELRGRVTELEEKLSQNVNNLEKLEIVLVNSTGEMISMKEEILNLHKAVTSLHAENKFSTPPLSSPEINTEKSSSLLPSNEDTSDVFYLSVQEGKKKLKINQESQTVAEVTQLRDLLRQVRIPLEAFTRRMLEHSLKTSSHLMAGNITGKSDDNSLKKIAELEGTVNKLRARLANKTEEVTQLRTIMKARQTTVDVTVSSLKSKLDSQNRAHETEINQLKHKIKTLRKERDDQTSLCALTSRRCQEYLGEISKLKRKIDEVRGECDQLRSENKLVNVYLERAIKQKLEISQQLERYREEEERTRMIPLTLSASRV